MRLKLVFSYDGSAFLGSACQPHLNSVQDALAAAIAHLGIFSPVLFASRTDKGVHALRAVACVECGEHFKDLVYLKRQINRFAHPFIHIKSLERVSENYAVRFDVRAREYRYILHHGEFNPFLSPYVCFSERFDIKKANELLSHFVGEKDFKFFQKAGGSAKTSVRIMFFARAYAYKDLSIFCFRANGFLRAQIRLSVASVMAVLRGELSEDKLKEQIEAKACYYRFLAPANGLYLSRIIY